MKIRRYKKVTKNVNFYTNNFGFRHPYQLLVDGTFCYAALNNKINISNDIPPYLQAEIKLLTTQCAIIEMEKLGPKLNGALLILKNYAVHKCGHEGKPITGSKCLLSMIGKKNENHYIICTQDRDLQENIRNVPGVPLLYLHMKTPVLEQPSPASLQYVKDKLSGLCESEKKALEELKIKGGIVTDAENIKKKKKKKGPNPLSCKKSKKKTTTSNAITKKEGQPEIEKKRRKRIRIPEHIKRELIGNK